MLEHLALRGTELKGSVPEQLGDSLCHRREDWLPAAAMSTWTGVRGGGG